MSTICQTTKSLCTKELEFKITQAILPSPSWERCALDNTTNVFLSAPPAPEGDHAHPG